MLNEEIAYSIQLADLVFDEAGAQLGQVLVRVLDSIPHFRSANEGCPAKAYLGHDWAIGVGA